MGPRDSERGASVIAEDRRLKDVARSEPQTGQDGYRADDRRSRATFPDGEVKITRVIVDGDWTVVEFVNRGTQTGPLKSSLGEFPPSGRRMEGRYCSVIRVGGGKMVEARDYYDSPSIARQLGLVV